MQSIERITEEDRMRIVEQYVNDPSSEHLIRTYVVCSQSLLITAILRDGNVVGLEVTEPFQSYITDIRELRQQYIQVTYGKYMEVLGIV